MKITVKADHLEPLILLISTYDDNKLIYGLMLEEGLTSGVLTRLAKIKKACSDENTSFIELKDAILERNNIKEGVLNIENSNHKKAEKEMIELLNSPVELNFDPISAEFIDGIVISKSKILPALISNIEYLAELFNIIKGEYIYPEKVVETETEVV